MLLMMRRRHQNIRMPPVAGMVTWMSFSPTLGNIRVTFLGLLLPDGWHSTCVEDNGTTGCTISSYCFTWGSASKIQELQCCIERSQNRDTLRSHRASLKSGHKLSTKSFVSLFLLSLEVSAEIKGSLTCYGMCVTVLRLSQGQGFI